VKKLWILTLRTSNQKERRQVLQTVNRKIRDARFFARMYLRAYSHRCLRVRRPVGPAGCGAHRSGGTRTRGQMKSKTGFLCARCITGAFDHALIGVRTDYTIACSEKEFQRLRSISWHGGESEFKAAFARSNFIATEKGNLPCAGLFGIWPETARLGELENEPS